MKKRRTGPKGVGAAAGTGPRAAAEPEEAAEGSLGEPEAVGGGEPGNDPPSELEGEAEGELGSKSGGGSDGDAEELPIAQLDDAGAGQAETGTGTGRYVDDSGLMEALQQLKVRRDRNRDLTIGIGCGIVGLVVGLIIGNTTAGSSGNSPAVVSPAVAASRGDLPDITAVPTQDPDTTSAPTVPDSSPAGVVTFTVTGKASGGVLITYGTNSTGSQSTKLPFTGSMPLDSSGGVLYYDVYAQLHGSGSLTCSVAVNGKVIKTGTATTTSDICSAQIAQDPTTGQWQSE